MSWTSYEADCRVLNCSPERVGVLVRAGLLHTVPGLSSPRKQAIAVAELERFLAQSPPVHFRTVAS